MWQWKKEQEVLFGERSVILLKPITVNEYAKKHIKSNPDHKIHDVKAALKDAVKRQNDGVVWAALSVDSLSGH